MPQFTCQCRAKLSKRPIAVAPRAPDYADCFDSGRSIRLIRADCTLGFPMIHRIGPLPRGARRQRTRHQVAVAVSRGVSAPHVSPGLARTGGGLQERLRSAIREKLHETDSTYIWHTICMVVKNGTGKAIVAGGRTWLEPFKGGVS